MIMCYKCYDVCGPWEWTEKGFLCDECSEKMANEKKPIKIKSNHKEKSKNENK